LWTRGKKIKKKTQKKVADETKGLNNGPVNKHKRRNESQVTASTEKIHLKE